MLYMWWCACFLCMTDEMLQWFVLCHRSMDMSGCYWHHDWMVYLFARMAWLMDSHSSLIGWFSGWLFHVPDGWMIGLSCMSNDPFNSVLMPWCVDIMAWYYMQMLWWSVAIGLWYVLWFYSGFIGRHMLYSGIDEVCRWDPQHAYVCDASFDLDGLADAWISVEVFTYAADVVYLCDAIQLGTWISVSIIFYGGWEPC